MAMARMTARSARRRRFATATVTTTATLLATFGLLAGCTLAQGDPGDTGNRAGEGGQGESTRQAAGAGGAPSVPRTTLRVLAGSELADMQPVLDEARTATGVGVEFDYVGTLEGAERVAAGNAVNSYDATWFSSDRYLSLIPGGNEKIAASQRIMSSPVVLGLLPASATRLGWDTAPPTWATIAKAASDGQFTFGMTNPAVSNSGFSALVGVSTALAGGGAAIDATRINKVTPQLVGFFSGQRITAGSSKWLADTFVQRASGATTPAGTTTGPVDGLVNYESVLLELSDSAATGGPLTLVYPADGVVSADYPLSLLEGAAADKRAAFDALAAWLRSPQGQEKIQASTHRRPVVPGVTPAAEFGDRVLIELPFPAQRSAADALIAAYGNRLRRPAQMVYALDVSGSMAARASATGTAGAAGSRLDALKAAFDTLSGNTDTTSEAMVAFNDRERVVLDSFSDRVRDIGRYEIPASGGDRVRGEISRAVSGLTARGNTALYDALLAAYRKAATEMTTRPDAFTTIVLMSDGERTSGLTYAQFEQAYQQLPAEVRAVPTFAILLGEADREEMEKLAKLTGGKAFDARSATLTEVFKEIRGYQ